MADIKLREKFQTFELGGIRYRVRRFDAMTGSYIAFCLLQKALPALMESQLGLEGGDRPQMPKSEFTALLQECLGVAEVEKAAGFLPVLDGNGHLDTALEYDSFAVMIIAMRAIRFNLEGFFSDEGGKALGELMQGLSLPAASV
jgi:hypothetical protein